MNGCRRKIEPMFRSKELRRAILFSIAAALFTVVPYLIASLVVEPGSIFSGFLINPVDGFSYLAKMQQGQSGRWLFTLPYAPEPGEGVLLFIFYIVLGKIVAITGLSPQFLYHLVRVVAAAAMFTMAYIFLSNFLRQPKLRWSCFYLILFGSGFGWLGVPFGFVSSDLKIPESIPFYSAFANPHFPVAILLLLSILHVLLKGEGAVWRDFSIVVILSVFLALVQPFAFLLLGSVVGIWQLWEIRVKVRGSGVNVLEAIRSVPWAPLMGMAVGATPWLLYDYSLTLNHEAIAIWNQQNLTPSPPPWEFILGLGGVLILAVIHILRRRKTNRSSHRMLITWAVVQLALLYAPFGLQRRLSLGLYIPLAILAVLALERIGRRSRINLAFAALFTLSIPSNLLVMASGLGGLITDADDLTIHRDELTVYDWMSEKLEDSALILANEKSGNRIPAFSALRVLYGHPFETPHADRQEKLVQSLLSPSRDPQAALEQLNELGVDYVLIGPEDLEEGRPLWLDRLPRIYSQGEYELFGVTQ